MKLAKILIAFSCVLIFGLLTTEQSKAYTPTDDQLIKITIKDGTNERFYGYLAPEHFFYRIGNQEIEGKAAKKAVLNLLERLPLSSTATRDLYVNQLKSNGFSDLGYVSIEWVDARDHFYTWIWSK